MNKRFIFLVSSIRSGSTLVKALLAEGGNVSHTPEINYPLEYGKPESEVRESLGKLSTKEIIVCKWTHEDGWKIPLENEKVIFLFRNVHSTLRSIYNVYEYRVDATSTTPRLNANPEDKKPPMGLSAMDLANWCTKKWANTYKELIKGIDCKKNSVAFLSFDYLLAYPLIATTKLFSFIESENKEGVCSYSMPENGYVWEWGVDDGGSKIKQMSVLERSQAEDRISRAGDEAIMENLKYNPLIKETLERVFEFKKSCKTCIDS